jgi:hypothetical protein
MKKSKSIKEKSKLFHDELFLQPWFLPKPTYLTLRRLLPSSQLAKMRYYFEDYGCLRCGSRNSIYASNGMCKGCSIVVRSRVVLCLAKRFRKIGVRVDKKPLKRFQYQLAKPRLHSNYYDT